MNATEDGEHGEGDDGSRGLPAQLHSRERRLAKLRAVRAQLEAERRERLAPQSQKGFADPDAPMTPTGDGTVAYAYNAQVSAF